MMPHRAPVPGVTTGYSINQLPWVPLARVLVPNFIHNGASQPEMIRFLIARGADPSQRLPFDSGSSVLQYARALKSPWLRLLEAPVRQLNVAARSTPPVR